MLINSYCHRCHWQACNVQNIDSDFTIIATIKQSTSDYGLKNSILHPVKRSICWVSIVWF